MTTIMTTILWISILKVCSYIQQFEAKLFMTYMDGLIAHATKVTFLLQDTDHSQKTSLIYVRTYKNTQTMCNQKQKYTK